MFGSGVRISYQRWLKIGLGAGLGASLFALMTPEAMARGYHSPARHHQHHAGAPVDNPAFSAIVVDENTGRELYGVNENALRHPASITKVMTLYLLFEQLEKGAMTLDTQIPISQHAAAQEPSKLGIAAGDSLRVEDAIKAVVTRSANDVAVAIAEAIGQDESSFAEMMTRKAHALGMSRTLYRNASGLPNDEQWTTARDLTILARSLEERYPTYFKYFATHEFNYDGEIIGNHNHLLGRIDGVDGIKTGYTRASGFNLLTSVHRDGRSLVAVVMGGRSAGARDRIMEGLIETHIAEASNRGHTATAIADNESPVPAPSALRRGATASPPPAVARATVQTASYDSGEGDKSDDETADVPETPAKVVAKAEPKTKPKQEVAAKPTATAAKAYVVASADPASRGWKKGPDAVAKAPARPDETRVARSETSGKATKGPAGWVIQIGAADDASKANALISRAKAKSRALADARPFTEKFVKDGDTFYRARFSGLDEGGAAEACKSLRRSGFSCFATHID
jgi:D-alanyl-D-alanine carboxypeptidase